MSKSRQGKVWDGSDRAFNLEGRGRSHALPDAIDYSVDGRSKGKVFAPALPCHKGSAPIAGSLYCTAEKDLASALRSESFKLVLDCTGRAKIQFEPAIQVRKGSRALQRIVDRAKLRPPQAIVTIDWPDFGLPPAQPGFWLEIERWRNGGKVLAVCMGGHGRSGTAIACLLAAGGIPSDEAIAMVRAQHCNSAVETDGQEAYVAMVEAARAQK